MEDPFKQTESIKERSFSKPDLGVKRSSDSDITSHPKSGLATKRFSQPDLINRRPLAVELDNAPTKKGKQDMKENLKKFETMKSIAETDKDKVSHSDKQLMNISRMKLNDSKHKGAAADKTMEAKPYLVPYKADPNYSVKDITFSEKGTLKPSAKYDAKTCDANLLSATNAIDESKLKIFDMDNRSAVSDSGLGSEYSVRTVKSESLSEFSAHNIRNDGMGDENTPRSEQFKLFEDKSAKPKSNRSRSGSITESRCGKKGFNGVKQTRNEKRGNLG